MRLYINTHVVGKGCWRLNKCGSCVEKCIGELARATQKIANIFSSAKRVWIQIYEWKTCKTTTSFLWMKHRATTPSQTRFSHWGWWGKRINVKQSFLNKLLCPKNIANTLLFSWKFRINVIYEWASVAQPHFKHTCSGEEVRSTLVCEWVIVSYDFHVNIFYSENRRRRRRKWSMNKSLLHKALVRLCLFPVVGGSEGGGRRA